jgi:hypothetical protein
VIASMRVKRSTVYLRVTPLLLAPGPLAGGVPSQGQPVREAREEGSGVVPQAPAPDHLRSYSASSSAVSSGI